MKKIMSIFSVVLFAFALTLSSCGESNTDKASVECSSDKASVECSDDCTKECCDKSCADDCAKECCAKEPCADDCAKACCLGCKATDGDVKCKDDHSCCASVNN